jgi:hypothetical protein
VASRVCRCVDALGRVIAEDILCPVDVPSHRNLRDGRLGPARRDLKTIPRHAHRDRRVFRRQAVQCPGGGRHNACAS